MPGNRIVRVLLAVALASAVAVACESSFGPVVSGEAARVELEPRSLELMMGDTAWVTAAAFDFSDRRIIGPHERLGQTVSGPPMEWTRSDDVARRTPHRFFRAGGAPAHPHPLEPDVAGIRVQGVGVGETWVRAQSGEASDSVRVTVTGRTVTLESVEAGPHTICGLDAQGKAFCWGHVLIMLGGGGGDWSLILAPAPLGGDVHFTSLAVGAWHTCGLDASGEAFCWGLGLGTGLLGRIGGTYENSADPLPVDGGLSFRQLSAGPWATCGITLDQALYCWGSDVYGRLGVGEGAVEVCPSGNPCSRVPVQVAPEIKFTEVSVGEWSSCAIDDGGQTYCWGLNADMQLGHVSSDECASTINVRPCSREPRLVMDAPHFTSVSVGLHHACGLTPEGRTFCWGHNGLGELGTGNRDNSMVPVPLHGDLRFSQITRFCGLTEAGEAHCWGPNEFWLNGTEEHEICAQSGSGHRCNLTPVAVSGGLTFRSISRVANQACGVTDDGAYCWGRGRYTGTGYSVPGESALPLRVYDGSPR